MLIKQRKRTQHVPILFLTAHLLDDEDVLRGYGVGAVDYLSKPVNAEHPAIEDRACSSSCSARRGRSPTLNDALQSEIAERQRAQEALQEANQELELRVAQRTAALTRSLTAARARTKSGCGWRWRWPQIAAWEWDLATGPDGVVDRSRGAVRLSARRRSVPSCRIFRRLHPEDVRAGAGGDRAGQDDGAVRVRIPRRPARQVGRLDHRARTDCPRRGRHAAEGRRRQPRHQRAAGGRPAAGAAAAARAAGARRSRAPEPAEGRVPGHAQPRAANADERHSRLVEHAGERQRRRTTPTTSSPSSAATPKPRRS